MYFDGFLQYVTCHGGHVDDGTTLLAMLFAHVLQCQIGALDDRRLWRKKKNNKQMQLSDLLSCGRKVLCEQEVKLNAKNEFMYL